MDERPARLRGGVRARPRPARPGAYARAGRLRPARRPGRGGATHDLAVRRARPRDWARPPSTAGPPGGPSGPGWRRPASAGSTSPPASMSGSHGGAASSTCVADTGPTPTLPPSPWPGATASSRSTATFVGIGTSCSSTLRRDPKPASAVRGRRGPPRGATADHAAAVSLRRRQVPSWACDTRRTKGPSLMVTASADRYKF